MILLIDIGNTRLKWAELRNGMLTPQAALAHTKANREMLLQEMLHAAGAPDRVLISNVGGREIGDACAAAICERWGIDSEFIIATAYAAGVTNAYREPEKLGVDRWLAIIAAHAIKRGSACVVSVGTAMTIDGIDATGKHLGGVIVPGPQLMIASLLKSTSEIAGRMTDEQTHSGLFAAHTLGAVEQGCAHALAALIDRAVFEMEQALRERPVLLLTGGASERIASLVSAPCESFPDLVLRGLAILAKSEQERDG